MLKNNYHTHTYLCNHAGGKPIDYAKEAIKLGFSELGISDHGPMPKELSIPDIPGEPISRNMNIFEFYKFYLPDFKEAYNKYHNDINLYLGLETEYYEKYHNHYKEMRSNLDYMILGVHWFYYKGKKYNTYGDITTSSLNGYVECIEKALATGLYDYLAHPDLFFIQYNKDKGDMYWDDSCDKSSRRIIEACLKNDIYIEVNANGPGNSRRFNHPNDWLYPCEYFWNIAKEYSDLKIVVGSDCHDPKNIITDDTYKIYDFIDRLGLKVLDKIEIKRKGQA